MQVIIWTGMFGNWQRHDGEWVSAEWDFTWQWEPYVEMDNDNRDDNWPEDFERYMTETGWLSEDER